MIDGLVPPRVMPRRGEIEVGGRIVGAVSRPGLSSGRFESLGG